MKNKIAKILKIVQPRKLHTSKICTYTVRYFFSLLKKNQLLILYCNFGLTQLCLVFVDPVIYFMYCMHVCIYVLDFAPLKTFYRNILQMMPDNYELSVEKLQNYISDDRICMILSSSNSTTANKIILDCLIERMSRREDLLDLCNQLETISTSYIATMLINAARSG